MQVRIGSYPPLGDVTTLSAGQIQLNVVFEVPKGQSENLWEVELWSSMNQSVWEGLRLKPCDTANAPTAFRNPSSQAATLHFATSLQLTRTVQFTLKFRRGPSDAWSWAKDVCGLDDGHIVTTATAAVSVDEGLPLPELASGWRVSERASQSPGSRLWALETDVKPSSDDTSAFKDMNIGKPWGSFQRWFSIVRHSSPWLGPRHGKTHAHFDQDAVLCSFQNGDGQHVVLLAVTADNSVESVLQSTDSGGVQLHARSDSTIGAAATVLVSLSGSFNRAVATVMYEARGLVAHASIAQTSDEVRATWREDWYDGLGYCTWNALGPELTSESLHDALAELADNEVKISNLIIDDGWQAVTDGPVHGWKTFEASKDAFPDGLKATISKLRHSFPGIDRIAVWHAINGYWGGISPDGEIARNYKTTEVECGAPYDQKMHLVDQSDAERCYDDFYKFLVNAGIDSVKTDNQHVLDCIVDAKPRRDLINTYLDAWTIASLRHFGYRTISCMSQFPQALFHSQMKQSRPTLVVRNSDDFFPEIHSSHTWHVWANAHNSLFTRYLNVLPDWDMFQTKHEYGGFHAAARCVSGGPIYITDVPGKHDMEIIRAMTGVTVRGKTVIFRPSVVGRSASHYIGFDEGQMLKVGAYHGPSGTGSPILGVFNITERPVAEIIPLSSFTGAVPTLDYVVRSYNTGRVSPRIQSGAPGAIFSVSLEVKGYDILTATPLALFPGDRWRHIWVGNIGLVGKMTGCAALVSTEVKKHENKRLSIGTRLKALGVLGVWISTLPDMSIDDDLMITILGEPIPRGTVRVSESCECLLEIDAERAWKEMKLSSGWGNEVEVVVTFST